VYQAGSRLILTKSREAARLRCSIRTPFDVPFLPAAVALRYGTLGIACTIWLQTVAAP
jgi:hypothetical protein